MADGEPTWLPVMRQRRDRAAAERDRLLRVLAYTERELSSLTVIVGVADEQVRRGATVTPPPEV